MTYHGKIQLTAIIIAPPDQVADGDRLFKEGRAGVLDHFEQSFGNWGDVQAFRKWLEKCKFTLVPAASIFNSLW